MTETVAPFGWSQRRNAYVAPVGERENNSLIDFLFRGPTVRTYLPISFDSKLLQMRLEHDE